jgi:integrase
VRQRADAWKVIGEPKSAAGTRTVPLPPQFVSILREWKLACPSGPLRLAFPNTRGNVDDLRHIVRSTLHPAMIAAGLVTADGKPKYPGMHALRQRRPRIAAKTVQARLGHSSIAMTADVYGHLFSRGDDGMFSHPVKTPSPRAALPAPDRRPELAATARLPMAPPRRNHRAARRGASTCSG